MIKYEELSIPAKNTFDVIDEMLLNVSPYERIKILSILNNKYKKK